jgi:fructose-bisphosphate aldolase/6-deoxy-5-ketofructose 1-phosphate synthase
MNDTILIPGDVPNNVRQIFQDNYNAITRDTGRLMLFAGDQKIEHMNADFYGDNIDVSALHPEHIFRIASQGSIGALATHLGLIARYGKQYPSINYIVKLNAKTNLIPTAQKDPMSATLWFIEHVVHFQQMTGLSIRGIGYTIYPGSEYEGEMFAQAAQIIYAAHQHGLVTILWVYPRGKSVHDESDGPALRPGPSKLYAKTGSFSEVGTLIAGAAGIANSLGADFVKVKAVAPSLLQVVTAAAGNTKVICSGGAQKDKKLFLRELYDQIHAGGTMGSATGRNIFQHSLVDAILFTQAISAIVYEDQSVDGAIKMLT